MAKYGFSLDQPLPSQWLKPPTTPVSGSNNRFQNPASGHYMGGPNRQPLPMHNTKPKSDNTEGVLNALGKLGKITGQLDVPHGMPTAPANNWNNGGGGGSWGGDWGGGYAQPQQPDPAELLRQLLEARKAEAARQRAEREAQARKVNEALMGEGKAMESRYQAQFGAIGNDYQDLKNQSEVNRYKAQRAMRETQANRGLLDSGAGRQDNLFLNSNYNNNLNKIMIKEAQERQRVQDAINSMWAKIGTEKTRNLASAITESPNFSTFDSLMPMLASGYEGNTSGLLKAALSVAQTAGAPTPNVKNYSNTTTGRALTDDDDYFSPKKIR